MLLGIDSTAQGVMKWPQFKNCIAKWNNKTAAVNVKGNVQVQSYFNGKVWHCTFQV